MTMTRRQAIKTTLLAGGVLTSSGFRNLQGQSPSPGGATPPAPAPTGPFKVPPLPYAYDALEPYIDKETMTIHHDKHHAAYVKKLNEAVAQQPELGQMEIADILKDLTKVNEAIRKAVRNQGGGHYNHSLFWQMMKPGGGASRRVTWRKPWRQSLAVTVISKRNSRRKRWGCLAADGAGWC